VAVGMTAMNAAAYLFTLLAARALGPEGYSAVAALMGVVLVANVVALGVQATTARHVATHEHTVDAAALLATGRRAGLALAAVALVLSPVLAAVFRLDSWLTAATVALTSGALAVTGSQLGILQGARRWRDFALLSTAFGAGRLLVGGGVLWVGQTPLAAMAGVAAGALVPVGVGHLLLRRDVHRGSGGVPLRNLAREVLHDTHILLAFFVLTQADVFVARATLAPAESGLYAAGLILTKAVLFLPTFVAVVAYPTLARRGGRRHVHHVGLLLVLAIGLVVVLGVLAMPALALAFVGGAAYAAVEPDLWLFALLGTVTAMVQLLVQTALARRHRSAVWWLWGALVAVAAGVPFVADGHELLLLVLGVDTVLLAVLVLITWSDDPPLDSALGVVTEAAEDDVSGRRRARSGRPRR
jgi:O-antigen/teichoic acid export membrane protein